MSITSMRSWTGATACGRKARQRGGHALPFHLSARPHPRGRCWRFVTKNDLPVRFVFWRRRSFRQYRPLLKTTDYVEIIRPFLGPGWSGTKEDAVGVKQHPDNGGFQMNGLSLIH